MLAHTVWVDCRQLAADAEQAEAAHQSAAVAARAELEAQARVRLRFWTMLWSSSAAW